MKTYIQYTYFILFLFITLLVFVGVFSVSATAQEQLQPTQVIADIPEQYNETFSLQWGGGSLYQLKQRLATMGCMVDTIFTYNNNQWNAYNQYQVPSTLNTQFLNEYSQFIPAGTLHASCFDICEFDYYEAPKTTPLRCSTIEMIPEHNLYDLFSYPIDSTNPCTTNFNPRIQASVLPVMPTYPDKCIIRQEINSSVSGGGSILTPIVSASNVLYPYRPAIIVLYTPNVKSEASTINLLGTEIHELCHTNQHWHFVENLQPDIVRSVRSLPMEQWSTTQAGKSFIDLVGFTKNAQGQWTLPQNSPYTNIYGAGDPAELSAELCALYFLNKMGEPDIYSINQNNFDINRYLTPEIVQWLETYVALPSN